jgi:hypothetical protein
MQKIKSFSCLINQTNGLFLYLKNKILLFSMRFLRLEKNMKTKNIGLQKKIKILIGVCKHRMNKRMMREKNNQLCHARAFQG